MYNVPLQYITGKYTLIMLTGNLCLKTANT